MPTWTLITTPFVTFYFQKKTFTPYTSATGRWGSLYLCQKIGQSLTHFQKENDTTFPRRKTIWWINTIGHMELLMILPTFSSLLKKQITSLHLFTAHTSDPMWSFKNFTSPISPSYLKMTAIKYQDCYIMTINETLLLFFLYLTFSVPLLCAGHDAKLLCDLA